MPRHRLHVQQLPLRIRCPLHNPSLTTSQDHASTRPGVLFSSLLGERLTGRDQAALGGEDDRLHAITQSELREDGLRPVAT